MGTNRLVWVFVGTIWLTVLGCSAPSPAWNGTWKLNESKSNIPGPSFSLTVLPTGEYHADNGTYSYNFRCDGKTYITRARSTISCTQSRASEMDTTATEDGTKFPAHWELSADGKTLTVKTTSAGTDEPVRATQGVYLRTFGSSGFVGGWQDKSRLASLPQLVLVLDKKALHIALSGVGQYMDPPLDGTDSPCHGSGVPQGLTMAIRPNGPREFLTLKKVDGKIVNQGSLGLSADGRTLVEEYWAPSRPDERAKLVYEKQ
jgi:hypothetical protein